MKVYKLTLYMFAYTCYWTKYVYALVLHRSKNQFPNQQQYLKILQDLPVHVEVRINKIFTLDISDDTDQIGYMYTWHACQLPFATRTSYFIPNQFLFFGIHSPLQLSCHLQPF